MLVDKCSIGRRTFLSGAMAAIAAPRARAATQRLPRVRIVGAAPVVRPDQGYLFLGIPMGYYRTLGFEGEFLSVAGSAAALQLVVTGSAEVANVGFIELLSIKRKQPTIPIRTVFHQGKISTYQIAVPDDGPIKTVADFKGRTLGVPSLGSGSVPMAQALLRQAGVDPATIPFLPIGAGAQALAAIKAGRVDGICAHIGQIAAMEVLGQNFRCFAARTPMGGLVMSDAWVKSNRDLAVRIFQGMTLNQMVMLKSPLAALRAYRKMSVGASEQKLENEIHYIKRTRDTFQQLDSNELWGDYSEGDWENLKSFLGSDSGLIPPNAKLSDYYSRDLIPDVNRLDKTLVDQAIASFS